MAASSVHPPAVGTWPVMLAAVAILTGAIVAMVASAARARPMSDLDRASACRLLAGAIAVELRISRAECRWIPHVAAALDELRRSGELVASFGDPWLPRPRCRHGEVRSVCDSVYAAYAVADWWDPSAPQLALIVAVADEWAALTSSGGPQAAHASALASLDTLTGTRLDPAAVKAAHAIVAREQRLTRHTAFQPRLHRIRSIDAMTVARRLFAGPSPTGLHLRSPADDRLAPRRS
jgi:hypothetical protein